MDERRSIVVWNLIGWVGPILVIGAVVYVLYKLLAGSSDPDEVDISKIEPGETTPDLGGTLSTVEVGARVRAYLG